MATTPELFGAVFFSNRDEPNHGEFGLYLSYEAALIAIRNHLLHETVEYGADDGDYPWGAGRNWPQVRNWCEERSTEEVVRALARVYGSYSYAVVARHIRPDPEAVLPHDNLPPAPEFDDQHDGGGHHIPWGRTVFEA